MVDLSRVEALKIAKERGLLSAEQSQAFDIAMERGLLGDAPQQPQEQPVAELPQYKPKETSPILSPLVGVAQQGARGLTFGLADELTGGVQAAGTYAGAQLANLINKSMGRDDKVVDPYQEAGREYRRATGEIRSEREAFQEAAPALAFATEVVPGMVAGGKSAGKVIGSAKTALGKVGRSAAIGAGEAGLYGAGEAEGGIGDRAAAGLQSAPVGAIGGAVLPVATKAIGMGIGKGISAGKKIARGGGTTAEDVLAKTGSIGENAGKYADIIEAAQKEGRDVRLTEVAPEAGGLGRLTRKMGGEAQQEIEGTLTKRAQAETKRIAENVKRNVSGKAYFDNLDEIQEVYAPQAKKAYKDAFDFDSQSIGGAKRWKIGDTVATYDDAFSKRAINRANKTIEENYDYNVPVASKGKKPIEDYYEAAEDAGLGVVEDGSLNFSGYDVETASDSLKGKIDDAIRSGKDKLDVDDLTKEEMESIGLYLGPREEAYGFHKKDFDIGLGSVEEGDLFLSPKDALGLERRILGESVGQQKFTHIDDIIDYGSHRAKASLFQDMMDDAGVSYKPVQEGSFDSNYFYVTDNDGGSIKVRFADHKNQSFFHNKADFNISTEKASGLDSIEDAINHVFDPKNNFIDGGGIKSEKLQALLQRPVAQDAFNELRQLSRVTGEAIPEDLLTNPTTKNIDSLKRGLDKMIDKEMDSITGKASPLGRELTIYKKDLLKEIDKINPAYKRAREIAGDPIRLRNAMDVGKNLKPSQSGEELARKVKGFSPAEKEALRVGLRDKIMTEAQKTVDRGSSARRVIGTEFKREQLRALFDNDKDYGRFMKSMNDEINAAETYQKIMGGSQSDINLSEGGQVMGLLADIRRGVGDFKQGIAPGIYGTVRSLVDPISRRYQGISNKNAVQLAKAIVNPEESVKILRKIADESSQQQKNIIQKFINDDAQAIVSGILAAKATGE